MPPRPDPRPEALPAIAARLRLLRATTGLSQQKFAARVGLGYQQWGNFEAAHGRIGIDAALTLCRAMPVTLDWIYRGIEDGLKVGLWREMEATAAAQAEPVAPSEPAPVKV